VSTAFADKQMNLKSLKPQTGFKEQLSNYKEKLNSKRRLESLNRAELLAIEKDLISSAREADRYKWMVQKKHKPVNQAPLCTLDDHRSILSDEASNISFTDARTYRREGPRMPYRMWPKRVGNLTNMNLEPDRYDTFVKMENEYYRKMHKLTRHLWKVNTPQNYNRKLSKVSKKDDKITETQVGDCSRDINQVEKDCDCQIYLGKTKDRDMLKLQELWKDLVKLRSKVIQTTAKLQSYNVPKQLKNNNQEIKTQKEIKDPSPRPNSEPLLNKKIAKNNGDDEDLKKLFKVLKRSERKEIQQKYSNTKYAAKEDFIQKFTDAAARHVSDKKVSYGDFYDEKNQKNEASDIHLISDNFGSKSNSPQKKVEESKENVEIESNKNRESINSTKETQKAVKINEEKQYINEEKEKKPTKEVAKRAALNETLSYKTTYADMFKWNARVKNHTDYNLIKKYYGKGTFWVYDDKSKNDEVFDQIRKQYKDAEKDETIKVPRKLKVSDSFSKDKLSKDLPPKTESELMAELIKFKQRHVGRIVPTYVSEYNGRYVDFSKS